MKIGILGAGAMGSVFGAHLAQAGEDVTLIDVRQETVDALNTHGLQLTRPGSAPQTVRLRATTDPSAVGPVDVLLIFVKCYHTQEAVRAASPLIGSDTAVLSLQNGWGNAPRIAEVVGERVLVGVTYHSATVLGPGQVHHSGSGMTFVGEVDGRKSERLERIVGTFRRAGLEMTATDRILEAIWAKLALNVCTLPTAALLRFSAGQLIEHEGVRQLMRGLLQETVAVAQAQQISLDEEERWVAITGLLSRHKTARGSMLQDVEAHRRTEIDVINAAVADAGSRLGVPTPLNDAMVWLVRSLEETF